MFIGMSLGLPSYQNLGTSGPTGILSSAVFLIDPANIDASGRWIENPNTSNVPSGNLLTYIAGDIRSMGITGITQTRNYGAGPTTAGASTRVQAAAAANYYLWQNSLPPAGQYACRIRLRATAGAGDQFLNYGNSASLVAATVTEAVWSDLVYVFTATGLSTNNNNFTIVPNGAGTRDYEIAEIQLYEGDGTNIPAFTAETFGGHAKRSPAWPGSLTISGGLIPNPASSITVALEEFLTGKTFSAFTMLVAVDYTTAVNNGCVFTTDRSAEYVTTNVSAGVITQTTVGAANNEINTNPISNAAGFAKIKPLGSGAQIIAVRVANGARSTFFHEIECNADATAFAGFTAKTMRIGAYSASQLPSDTTGRFLGSYGIAAMWDRALTDEEIYSAVQAARTTITGNGASMGTFSNFWIAEGDSITANAASSPTGPGYFTLATAAGEFTPSLNGRNFAVAGTNLSQARARFAANARVYQQAAMNGRNVIWSGLFGTNDAAAVVADPSAYYNEIKAAWAEVRAAGYKVIATTLLPKDFVGYNVARALINTMIRADSALYDALADVGGSATVGADSAPTDLVYYYDGTHPNAAGHLEMLPLFKSALSSIMV
jgi:lysophospholipase L1-like esterase